MRALERRITALESRPVQLGDTDIDDARMEALAAKIRALKEQRATYEPDLRPPQEQLAAEQERYVAALRERDRPDRVRLVCDDALNALDDKIHKMRVDELQKKIAAAEQACPVDIDRSEELDAPLGPAVSVADNCV